MAWQITKILIVMFLWPIILPLLFTYVIAKTCIDAIACVGEDVTR